MNAATFLLETETAPSQISRATVVEVRPDGAILCICDGEDAAFACQLLQSSEGPAVAMAPGDAVLVWLSGREPDAGVILGRLGRSRPPAPKTEETPDELVLEAKKEITLKCGGGSITLRGDGKILIKGKDLVSRAQRLNRIKGGAVAIN